MIRLRFSPMLFALFVPLVAACAHDEQQDMHQRPAYSYENISMGQDGYEYRHGGRSDSRDSYESSR
ncbi:MAG TPA: hypothetical protein VJ746_09370 [Nitrospira sp.]|nr:hypothetical protein [Nitrospira sp.]